MKIENLNGLEVRLQVVVNLQLMLMDKLNESGSISITFDWRRNSQQEPVLDKNDYVVMIGQPPRQKDKFYRTRHTIDVVIERNDLRVI